MSRRHAQLEMEPVYGFFYGICRMTHQMFFRGDVAGLENLPKNGGYIVAAGSTHISGKRYIWKSSAPKPIPATPGRSCK